MNVLTKKNQLLASALTTAAIFTAAPATAKVDPNRTPRGAQVGYLAGNCPVGPFTQTSKAGSYNEVCHMLTDAEICLGYIKQFMKANGGMRTARNKEKAEHCLGVFASELLGDN